MTVSTTVNKVSYTASAAQTTFAYIFKIFADGDLKVYVNSTQKTLTTDYTVTGAGDVGGGNIVFGTGLSASDSVVIERVLDLTQGVDYVENDAFPAETHEDALDRLTFITQQHQDALDRTVRFATTVTDAGDVEVLGSVSARASKLFAFDSAGDLDITQEIGVYKGTDATTTTAAYIQRDLVKSTTTAQLSNVYICTAASAVGTLLTNTSYWALVVDAVTAASSATAAASSATAAAGSATSASTSATNAATSATSASTAETNAETAETNAETAQASAETAQTAAEAAQSAAEAVFDNFDDRYLGAKASAPTLDNDGNALIDGAMYYDTTLNITKIYDLGTTTWNRTTPTTAEQATIDIVSGISANVTTVAGISADTTTVAGISGNVTTVAGIASDVTTTAGNTANINTVAGNNTNITTVAGVSTNVTAVAGSTADMDTCATNIANINLVASNINTGVIDGIFNYGSVADSLSSSTDYGSL